MRYLCMLVAAGTLLSSFCASAPTVSSEPLDFLNSTALPSLPSTPESHQRAAAAGIDIYGEIPEDYTHKNGSAYHFAEGSNASTWARAQLDIEVDSIPADVKKRWVYSNVGIGMWAGYDCTGNGYWVWNVAYNADWYPNTWPQEYVSVGISYRGLYDGIEQLDFSVWDGISPCGKYLYTAGSVKQPEYWNTIPLTCFRLLLKGPS